jgi:hypothetical protein
VWHPLSGLDYTGRLRILLPAQFGGAVVLYVGAAFPLDLDSSGDDGDPVPMNMERLVLGPGVFVPPDYWLEDGSPMAAPRYVSRVLIDASGEASRSVLLSLGRRVARVLARAIGYPPNMRVPVCAEPIAAGEIYFATGWYGQDRDSEGGVVRWMKQHGAVLVSSPDGLAARVRARLAPAAAGEATQLSVRVNDVLDLDPIRLRPGFHDYEFAVPDEAWVAGTNELLFSVSHTRTDDSRVRGAALASLHVQ